MKLTTLALTNIKKCISDNIAYAGYEEPNGNVTKMDISGVTATIDGTLRFLVKANFSSATQIMVLSLFDSDGNCWLRQPCDIRIDVTENTMVTLWFDFKVEEEL